MRCLSSNNNYMMNRNMSSFLHHVLWNRVQQSANASTHWVIELWGSIPYDDHSYPSLSAPPRVRARCELRFAGCSGCRGCSDSPPQRLLQRTFRVCLSALSLVCMMCNPKRRNPGVEGSVTLSNSGKINPMASNGWKWIENRSCPLQLSKHLCTLLRNGRWLDGKLGTRTWISPADVRPVFFLYGTSIVPKWCRNFLGRDWLDCSSPVEHLCVFFLDEQHYLQLSLRDIKQLQGAC